MFSIFLSKTLQLNISIPDEIGILEFNFGSVDFGN